MKRGGSATVGSIAALARALGVHAGTARRWVRNGCPRNDDDTFDVQRVRAWVENMRDAGRRKAASKISGGHESETPDDDLGGGVVSSSAHERNAADAQMRRIKTALLALELREKRAELVPRRDVEALLIARMQTFKRALRAVARRLAPELVNVPDVREIQAKISQAHDDLLWDAYGGKDADAS